MNFGLAEVVAIVAALALPLAAWIIRTTFRFMHEFRTQIGDLRIRVAVLEALRDSEQ